MWGIFLPVTLAACARYHRSLYEDHQRELSGSKVKHRESQRRLARKKSVRSKQFLSDWYSVGKYLLN